MSKTTHPPAELGGTRPWLIFWRDWTSGTISSSHETFLKKINLTGSPRGIISMLWAGALTLAPPPLLAARPQMINCCNFFQLKLQPTNNFLVRRLKINRPKTFSAARKRHEAAKTNIHRNFHVHGQVGATSGNEMTSPPECKRIPDVKGQKQKRGRGAPSQWHYYFGHIRFEGDECDKANNWNFNQQPTRLARSNQNGNLSFLDAIK